MYKIKYVHPKKITYLSLAPTSNPWEKEDDKNL